MASWPAAWHCERCRWPMGTATRLVAAPRSNGCMCGKSFEERESPDNYWKLRNNSRAMLDTRGFIWIPQMKCAPPRGYTSETVLCIANVITKIPRREYSCARPSAADGQVFKAENLRLRDIPETNIDDFAKALPW